MADAPENLKEAQKTESRSIEEPKIRTPDRRLDARKRGRTQVLGQSESWRRSDWRHETESSSWAENRETKDSGLRINERGQIHDRKGSDADIGENLQRRSHETESRSLPHKKRASILDWGDPSEYPDHPGERDRRENRENEHSGLGINEAGKMQHSLRDVEMQQRRSHETESRFLQHKNRNTNRRFDERIESNYPVRAGERNCMYYIKTGLCGFGRHCVLNHPRCKYFMRGDCKNGSACQFIHPKNVDRSYETESSSRPEKRARTNTDLRERWEDLEDGEIPREQEKNVVKNPWILKLEKRYNKDITEIRDGIVAGYKRTRMEQGQRENIEWQRMEEQRLREEQREKDIEKQRREKEKR